MPQRVQVHVYRFPQVGFGLFRKPGNEGNGGAHAKPVSGGDDLPRLNWVQALVNNRLHASRSGLNTEEDSVAAGSRHQLKQLFIHTVSAGTAGPLETFS